MATILTGQILVEPVGLEPTMPEAADLQSAGVTNFPTTPKLSYKNILNTQRSAGTMSFRLCQETEQSTGNLWPVMPVKNVFI